MPETDRSGNREKSAIRASLVAVLVNAALVAVKAAVGWLSGSVAVLGDAVNNLSDAASGVITLVGFRMAARPADAEHPYGHGRMEYLAGLSVSVMVLAIGMNLLMTSVRKCLNPALIEMSRPMFILLGLSIAVKGGLFFYYSSVGKRIGANAMEAAAEDSRNDMLTTSGILAAALLEMTLGIPADGWVGLLMAVYILVSGIRLVHRQVSPLLGGVPSRKEVAAIRSEILSHPQVLGMHDLMVHEYGPGREFASAHVEMPASMSPIEMHEIIDGIEETLLKEQSLHMVIHCDPVVMDDARLPEFKAFLEGDICRLYPGMTFHDLRIVPAAARPTVLFDCVVPYGNSVSMEELTKEIRTCFEKRYPGYLCFPTVEHSYTGQA